MATKKRIFSTERSETCIAIIGGSKDMHMPWNERPKSSLALNGVRGALGLDWPEVSAFRVRRKWQLANGRKLAEGTADVCCLAMHLHDLPSSRLKHKIHTNACFFCKVLFLLMVFFSYRLLLLVDLQGHLSRCNSRFSKRSTSRESKRRGVLIRRGGWVGGMYLSEARSRAYQHQFLQVNWN